MSSEASNPRPSQSSVRVLIEMYDADAPLSPGGLPLGQGRLYEKRVDWTAIPPVGVDVILDDDGGWSQMVKRAFWSTDCGEVQVELERCIDSQDEDLEATLVEKGWTQI